MKTKVFLFVIFCGMWITAFSQKETNTFDNKGAWFIFDPEYKISMVDLIEVFNGIDTMVAGNRYHLSNGEVFIPMNPAVFKSTMEEIFFSVDGTINIADSISEHGVICDWDDNISGTFINMGMKNNGKSFIADANYEGTKDGRFLNYKGYPVLKINKPCLNPIKTKPSTQNPKILTQQPLMLPNVLEQEMHVSFDEINVNVNVNHKMDTLVVLHLIQNQIEQQAQPEKIFTPNPEDKEKTWFGKNWPWVAGATAFAIGTSYGFLDGNPGWYGIGGENPVASPEEFDPVDALPQARLFRQPAISFSVSF